jgi:hypothetical protein
MIPYSITCIALGAYSCLDDLHGIQAWHGYIVAFASKMTGAKVLGPTS